MDLERVQQTAEVKVHAELEAIVGAFEFQELDAVGMPLQGLKGVKLVLGSWCLGKGFDSDPDALIEEEG